MDGLADLLATRREDILWRYERDVSERSPVEPPRRSLLLDALPGLLDALHAELLAAAGPPSPPEAPRVAAALGPPCGGEELPRLVREYGVLRDCLLGLLAEAGGAPRHEELRVLHRWLDGALLGELEAHQRQTAEFRERFLGVVSHDLRNPLNIVLLSASTLLRDAGLPERTTRGLRRIATGAERMARLIAELLDFTRGRLGTGLVLHRQPAELREVCRGVLEELREAAPAQELRLSAQEEQRGEWDVARLAQLVGTLATLALDDSPREAPVTVSLRDEGDAVRLEVSRAGAPLPATELPGLFEPFRRAARAGQQGAPPTSGLELYIARQIALAHGGTLEVRSTPEEGTTFTARLPRRAPEAPRG